MPFCHAIFPAVYISKRLYEFHLLSLPLATGEIFTQPLIEKSDLQSAYISSSDLERDEHGEDEEADERREDLEGGEAEPPQELVQLEEHRSPSFLPSLSARSPLIHAAPGLEILRWIAVLRRLSPRPRGL